MTQQEIIQKHWVNPLDIGGVHELKKRIPKMMDEWANEQVITLVKDTMDEYAKQEVIYFLHWIISPRKSITLSSGTDCFYINGNEVTYEDVYNAYILNKQKITL